MSQTLRVTSRSREKGNTPKLKDRPLWGAMWGKVGYGGAKWRAAVDEWGEEGGPCSGTHTPRLDDKGRLILPAKYRDELADGLVITRFQERCLAIWPISAFDEVTKTARSASSSQQDVRDYQRMLRFGASDEVPDKQGRITIPPHLRLYAGLEKECVVVGAIERVEVWNAAAWEQYSAEKEPALPN